MAKDDGFSEVGTTGVPQWMGILSDRHLEALRGPNGIDQMARLLRKESACFTLNNAINLTVQPIRWKVTGATDKPADRRAAEFIESCLHDMSTDWWSAVQFAMSGSAFGFSDLHIVYKRRLGRSPKGDLPKSSFNDGRIGLRKLAIRRQETIDHWELDEHGGLQAMIQRDPVTGMEYPPVPIERLLHFKFGADRGSPEGIGWLEPAYRLAKMIENLEIIYGIGQQRAHIGIPVFKYLVNPDETTKAKVAAIGRNLVVNEQQYVAYPGEIVDFRMETVNNPNASETREMISQLRWEIMMCGLGQFLRLGSTASGSRALADPLIVMFINSIDGATREISSVFNRYMVDRLISANPAIAQGVEEYPQIQASSAAPPPDVLAYLGNIQTFINSAEAEDQVWLRSLVGMPQMTVAEIQRREEEEPPAQPPPPAQQPPEQPQAQDGQQEAGQQQDQAAEAGLTVQEAWRLVRVADEYKQAAAMLERATAAATNGHHS